jgi:1,2-diacylglycerol 3-beta-galactosyltransferase
MHAADILLTKAGPGTISEAISAGLPVILFSRLDGTEVGNVRYLVDHGAGIWAPSPDKAVEAVIRWLEHPEERTHASSVCRTLSRPQAAREIADLLMTRANDIV